MGIPGFDGLFDAPTMSAALGTLAKLGIAAVLGGLVGIEREITRRPAGIRTHMLVCMGCALFTELSTAFGSVSPDRVAGQIVTGVGFLGAGTILRTGLEVKGLTTAASIWAVAAIGMAVAVGGPFLWVAVVATAMTLGTLMLVGVVEDRFDKGGAFRVMNVSLDSRYRLPALISAISEVGAEVGSTTISGAEGEIRVGISVTKGDAGLLAKVAGMPGVQSAEWSDLV